MRNREDQAGGETREDIPLKRTKKSKWYYCQDDTFKGSKYVNIAFGSLTLIITAALLIQIYYGDYQVVPHGSVASDSFECSNIGTSILKQGGTAVDAVIATTFCLTVAAPHLTSLDGNGQLLVYSHRTKVIPTVIDFNDIKISNRLPRLVLGLMFTHSKYASLAWKDLVQPSADLARKGCLISRMLVQAIANAKAEEIFGRLEPGQLLKQENLATTLDQIANIKEEDMETYLNQVRQLNMTQARKFEFHNYNIYVPDSPSVGQLLVENFEKFREYNFTKSDIHSSRSICKMAEINRDSYSREIGNISKFYVGTFSNVAVIDRNDNYVSLVSGMYKPFGDGEMTVHGYILDVETSEQLHSTSLPVIMTSAVHVCGRRLVFGANNLGLSTQMMVSLAIADENATEIIESPRFHITTNGNIGIEDSHLPVFGRDTIACLEAQTSNYSLVKEPYPSSNIIEKSKDDLTSHSDSRGGGIASRY